MCYYVRLSGGQHGFYAMSVSDAAKAAQELGAVKEVVCKMTNRNWPVSTYVFSLSYLDADDNEVFLYSRDTMCGQVFDPPRVIDDRYKQDYTL